MQNCFVYLNLWETGTQWLSGRVLDLRPKGCGFEPHRRHCIVSLSKTHKSLLSTGSTQEDPSRHNWKIVDWDVKNQIKQTKAYGTLKNKESAFMYQRDIYELYVFHHQVQA